MSDNRSFHELQQEHSAATRRGVTLIGTAALVLAGVAVVGCWLPASRMGLVLFGGMGLIFPLGLLLTKLLGINFFIKNPLGQLGGLAAVWQQFFTPLFIWFYCRDMAHLPLVVGVVAGAHFLIYAWIYTSPTYYFLAGATVVVAYVAGLLLPAASFVAVPGGMALVYGLGVLGLLRENRRAPAPARVASNTISPDQSRPAGRRLVPASPNLNPFFDL